MQKKALILGITGQDGSYLAEILLEKGYQVHGLIRRSATGNLDNISHLLEHLSLHRGDLTDTTCLYRIIGAEKPDEIYNEADQDHVAWSFDGPAYSYDVTGAAVGRLLEVIRLVHPTTKLFQPVSSNIFGEAESSLQNEESRFNPQSPYAAAKVFALVLCRYYRNVYGLSVSTGILFNHESPRRPEEYVSRKITKAVAKISAGLQNELVLGNIHAEVDFGYAREFMEAAHAILQLDKADDYVLSTGVASSILSFARAAFELVGLNADDHIRSDKDLFRPGNTTTLIGDHSKATSAFGFKPKILMPDLVKLMVEEDVKLLAQVPG